MDIPKPGQFRPFILLLTAALGVCGCAPPESADSAPAVSSPADPGSTRFDPAAFAAGHWVDLTHPFNAESIYWPTADGFEKTAVFEGHTEGGWYYAAYNFSAAEHGGTHLDAPVHFAEGRQATDAIPLERLIAPAVVIDVSAAVGQDRDYQIAAQDIAAWEAENGEIERGAIVLFNTDSAQFYSDRIAYMGTDERGEGAVAKLHFPGIHPEASELLVARGVGAVGIDTPSIDYGQSQDFRSHVILYEENIPGFENVANLDQLPPRGALVVALPMKIEGGSGGPLRIVARVPEKEQGRHSKTDP